MITPGFLAQITGIEAIISYSSQLLATMGFQGNSALLALPALG
ncbi:hypothetical protein [Mycobacterium lepromatosis]|nr:hypothetical protein [Mycobacterium lepromatosis]